MRTKEKKVAVALRINHNLYKMDLRSDGSCVTWFYQDYHDYPLGKKTVTWSLDKNSVTVEKDIFKIEGDDLIDSKGNRWIHGGVENDGIRR